MTRHTSKNWLNTSNGYGRLSIATHWLSALLILLLFASGFWMVTLTYYDSLYRTAPYYHKSAGVLLFSLIMTRLIFRTLGEHVNPAEGLTSIERFGSQLVHRLLYVGMVVVPLLGYGISTADGRGIEVFGLFTIPALPYSWPNQEDTLGWLHKWGAYTLVTLAVAHGAMAGYHGRRVWGRMWFGGQGSSDQPPQS